MGTAEGSGGGGEWRQLYFNNDNKQKQRQITGLFPDRHSCPCVWAHVK